MKNVSRKNVTCDKNKKRAVSGKTRDFFLDTFFIRNFVAWWAVFPRGFFKTKQQSCV
jgi:hypothetical protein